MITLDFKYGTLLLRGDRETLEGVPGSCVYDERVECWRAEACDYAAIVMHLHRGGIPYEDGARAYDTLGLELDSELSPRDYQAEAVAAWFAADRRGVIALPTGSGKSFVARMAIARTDRSTLVVVPTLDLMEQWSTQLARAFGTEIGLLGGGSKEVRPITVSTYDSAVLMMEFLGNRFGLLIADECHHLPGAVNQTLARMCIAPFRLGLSATPDRDDGADTVLYDLMGAICYRKDIDELEGKVLAPYRTRRLELELEPDEAEAYERNRAVYVDFVRANGIRFSSPGGWAQFLCLCARHPQGREAFDAYLAQKRIARTSRAKFAKIWELFREHAGERILIFTADNLTAYEIGRRFLLPVLTHHTKMKERKAFLDGFRAGAYPVLATSKVLNEGVDVPEASVGVVVSGSGSVREHVQRLGRILRPVKGKQAVLYELVSLGTSESYTSERRRQHRAYQRSS
ncbi:MAG: DEAD/DEAH box helicase family protein [Lentisphaeria bacterium]|nr:DEAD/DEAH box helicase family protein [Lentisphaeria bacterium]